MSYPKPWIGLDEQLRKLEARGLLVSDRDKALEYLKRIGYYRLSGYWFAFRERSGVCCVLDALERIEVALRVDVSHTLGELDPFAYLQAGLFHRDFSQVQSGLTRHHEWLGKHAQLIGRSREEFVTHNKTKYGLPLAIWVACEVWDFGTLSTLYGGMREPEQDVIAARYGVRNGWVFATWLRSLNYLRNVCAHHSRWWNRNIVDQPRLPSAAEMPWVAPFEQNAHARARCYLLLCMVRHLLQVINPTSSLPKRMRAHLKTFPDLDHLGLNLVGMGAGADWEAQW